MERKLEGKVILVAGAGGIGGGLAERYAAEGARVVLGDIDRAAAEQVAAKISAVGHDAIAIMLDGADEASAAAAVATCKDVFGGLDGLHANFANFADSPGERGILELPLEIFDETQRINVRGFYLCTRGGATADSRTRQRVYPLHQLDRRLSRRAIAGCLCGQQGRGTRTDAACRFALRSAGHSGQQHRAGLYNPRAAGSRTRSRAA